MALYSFIFVLGVFTGIVIKMFWSLPIGTIQLDMREHPFIFRIQFTNGYDLDDVAKKKMVSLLVDTNWIADREQYIREITEEDVNS